MHELANMAADKAQQAQGQQNPAFPPPPAEFISPPDKVCFSPTHFFLYIFILCFYIFDIL